MKLKYVVPKMKEMFGKLEFAGAGDVESRSVNGRRTVINRTYNLYSEVQRTEDISVIIPGKAGEKHFNLDDTIKLINPRLVAVGYAINGRGYSKYVLMADDIVKE